MAKSSQHVSQPTPQSVSGQVSSRLPQQNWDSMRPPLGPGRFLSQQQQQQQQQLLLQPAHIQSVGGGGVGGRRQFEPQYQQQQQQYPQHPQQSMNSSARGVPSLGLGAASMIGGENPASLHQRGPHLLPNVANVADPDSPVRAVDNRMLDIYRSQPIAIPFIPERPAESSTYTRHETGPDPESPNSRQLFRDFMKAFHAKERISFQSAKDFAQESFGTLPEKVHWKIYLEIADLAKRENHFEEARRLYKKVWRSKPCEFQGWLEHAKLEEECGDLKRCAAILRKGLVFCEYSESLLTKAIKLEEKMGNLSEARLLLARLKHVPIDKVWRSVLEGALLEARAGNLKVSRELFKYLMFHVPWYGPIYYEAFRVEEKAEHHSAALAIVERGLREIPRYGPLWFGAFRLCETMDIKMSKSGRVVLTTTQAMAERALTSISKELLWKVHFEMAQICERAALMSLARKPSLNLDEMLKPARRSFAKAALACTPNLHWKVWVAGGRMELSAGKPDVARQLFSRAYAEVPEKSKTNVFLESARLEEIERNLPLARAIFTKARSECKGEWKVFLESVLLEMRAGSSQRAIELAEKALRSHTGTGRLWAMLVQLRQGDGEAAQTQVLKHALIEVPKSGEVWCEGARIHLNPFSKTFNLVSARRFLTFAVQFTPQYGDSFMEYLRLEMLEAAVLKRAKEGINEVLRLISESDLFRLSSSKKKGSQVYDVGGGSAAADDDDSVASSISSDEDSDLKHLSLANEAAAARSLTDRVVCLAEKQGRLLSSHLPAEVDEEPVINTAERQRESGNIDYHALLEELMDIDTSELTLRCTNADPNYGSMWFICRRRPTDTAMTILKKAKEMIAKEIAISAALYVTAIVRRAGIEAIMKKEWTYRGGRLRGATTASGAISRRGGEHTGGEGENEGDFDHDGTVVEEGADDWDALLEDRLLKAPAWSIMNNASPLWKVDEETDEGSTTRTDDKDETSDNDISGDYDEDMSSLGQSTYNTYNSYGGTVNSTTPAGAVLSGSGIAKRFLAFRGAHFVTALLDDAVGQVEGKKGRRMLDHRERSID